MSHSSLVNRKKNSFYFPGLLWGLLWINQLQIKSRSTAVHSISSCWFYDYHHPVRTGKAYDLGTRTEASAFQYVGTNSKNTSNFVSCEVLSHYVDWIKNYGSLSIPLPIILEIHTYFLFFCLKVWVGFRNTAFVFLFCYLIRQMGVPVLPYSLPPSLPSFLPSFLPSANQV